jgi:hypothetical protein
VRRPCADRPGRLAGAIGGLGLLGVLLGGCGSGPSGGVLVQEACAHVERSLTLYHRSTHEDGAAARRAQAAALVQLRDALRPAALAGSAGGQSQALQATLSESSRVPEGRLVTALSAQCPTGASAGG